jgi:predicted TIM-barrel fold metal-dependent hydrolase
MKTSHLDVNAFISSVDLLGIYNPNFLIPTPILEKYAGASVTERRELDSQYHVATVTETMRKHSQNILLYRSMLHELGRFLGCNEKLEEIVASRNAVSREYRAYLKKLYEDVKIATLLVDDGYSELAVEHGIPHLEIDDFAKSVPVKVARVTRIEPLIQESLNASEDLSTFLSLLMDRLEEAVKKRGAVAYKSLIAYRSGLDVGNPTETQAKDDFQRYKTNKERTLKALRDYVLRRVLEKCLEFDVPLQIHTGFGDVDILLDRCNPIHLFPLLKDTKVRHAKVVLVHCGYPYTNEAAYLTNVLPNIYLDLSVLIPYATANMPNRILEVMELAPASKILYASDATQIPEMHWLSAKLGKRALEQALNKIAERSVITDTEAYEIAKMILADNAKFVYKLP